MRMRANSIFPGLKPRVLRRYPLAHAKQRSARLLVSLHYTIGLHSWTVRYSVLELLKSLFLFRPCSVVLFPQAEEERTRHLCSDFPEGFRHVSKESGMTELVVSQVLAIPPDSLTRLKVLAQSISEQIDLLFSPLLSEEIQQVLITLLRSLGGLLSTSSLGWTLPMWPLSSPMLPATSLKTS